MSPLTGTGALVGLAVRRDRVTVLAWVAGLAFFAAATTALWAADFGDPADLLRETRITATSPGIRLLGLASGASVGAYAMVRNFVLLAVLAALMSIFSVTRHTRQSEETGRTELVRAAVVGRHAALAAALIVTVAADVVLAFALGGALLLTGRPVAGSFAAGCAVGAVGIAFAGIAAVTGQLSGSARGANGQAAGVLGAAFLAAGVGNMAGTVDPTGLRVTSAWPAWLSPIGWGQQVRPFGGDHWWPPALHVVVLLGATAAAVLLTERRDFGLGVLAQRPGPAHAGPVLRRTTGLALRLQRGALLGWSAGLLGFGLIMGGLIGQVADATGTARDWYVRMGGSDEIVDAYRASILQMAAMAAAMYAVQVLLRLRAEEAGGPLEPVLATAVSRLRWTAGHLAAAVAGVVVLLLLFAVGAGVAAGAVLGDPAGQTATLVSAALVQIPAVLVIAAVVVALCGARPGAAAAVSWAALVAAIVIGPLFGPTLRLPQWAQDLSPFTHAPRAPALPVPATPVLVLLAVAATLTLTGLLTLRRRDLVLPA
ncbi:ABC antibiotics transporter [Actinoplanes sp. NPDC049316]|uniref:ABC transporter permease n=1 Tax=Actinoplanes sp. NPDC049316 TaxID=3154727 RepID=UPI0034209FF1